MCEGGGIFNATNLLDEHTQKHFSYADLFTYLVLVQFSLVMLYERANYEIFLELNFLLLLLFLLLISLNLVDHFFFVFCLYCCCSSN